MPIPSVLPEYRPGRPAAEADAALKQAVHTMDRARHCAVLWFSEILERRLYRELGFASIQLYAARELGFSTTRTGDFLRMARKLDDLPAIKRSLASGRLGYTKAREIIKVATPQTEKAWVRTAVSTPRRELEKEVAQVRGRARTRRRAPTQKELLPVAARVDRLAAAVPVRVQLEMTPEQFARYEGLLELLQKQGGASDRVDRILEALAALAAGRKEGSGEPGNAPADNPAPAIPRGANFQVHVRQCPDCGRNSVSTSRGDLVLGPADSGRVACDSQVDDPLTGRNRRTVPPLVRRRVMARDHHRCRTPGCTSTRFLEVHHIVPRSRGGSTKARNLITLCGACHRHTHRTGEEVKAGQAQGGSVRAAARKGAPR